VLRLKTNEEEIHLENLPLDDALSFIEKEVSMLSRDKMAALFGIAGEALLPLYISFNKKHDWGNPKILHEACRQVLLFAIGSNDMREIISSMKQDIADATPDGEKFDAPESTFAQDVAICIDAAIRCADLNETVNPGWIEYALEPAIQMTCEQQTGFLDSGSLDDDNWQMHALQHGGLRKAFECCLGLIRFLQNRNVLSDSDIQQLKSDAKNLLLQQQ